MAPNGVSTVLVTGASGYIATHVIRVLLERGYQVKGTVRSLKNEVKVKALRDLCPDAPNRLELVEADLTVPETWDRAVEGCSHVIHVASPLPGRGLPRDPEREMIRPAVEGTLSVLRACRRHRVVRVVITSSVAAVAGFGDVNVPDREFSERDWTDITIKNLDPYYISKTRAERAAWDFVQELPDEEKFELAVINPSYVVGPVICGADAASMEVPKRLMQREVPLLPKIHFPCCDVRDVAEAHVNAMTVPEAAGNRHLINSEYLWMKDIAAIIEEEFKSQGYTITSKQCPNAIMSVVGLFDKQVKMIIPYLGKTYHLDNTRMKTVLGVKGRDIRESIIDMCYSMVERGFVKRTAKYKGPPHQQCQSHYL